MLSSYLIYVCFAAFAIVLSAHAMHKEKKISTCRESSVFQNFNATRFLGRWYLYSSYHHDFEDGCDCFTSEVVALDAAVTSFQITNCCQMTEISNATQRCNLGVNHSRLKNPEKKDANFMYIRTGVTVESPTWIIDIDYDNYMIIHGCDQISHEEERETLWIMTRNVEINAKVAMKIDEVIAANNFEKDRIIEQRNGADVCKSKRPSTRTGRDNLVYELTV
ncbi:apolipoprotein D-like [Bradysia coprophila]|uniref:apolipoprotein D-like n=1 Tax=Bradysia coprophila TaxID=38358 RepID=UPI00187D7C2F|nr:apolipoprotein D-like [Bradysia coprophila]